MTLSITRHGSTSRRRFRRVVVIIWLALSISMVVSLFLGIVRVHQDHSFLGSHHDELPQYRQQQMKQLLQELLDDVSNDTTSEQELRQLLQQVLAHLEEQKQTKKVDTQHGTVIAMASGYGLTEYRRFVGSLRLSGFQGHIILGSSPNMKAGVQRYLQQQNVTVKLLNYVNCTYVLHKEAHIKHNKNSEELRTCVDPYPNIKLRWSRFPLARDWLQQCEECTGPVLVSDFRDVLFQQNPFEDPSSISGLQVFEEHWSIDTSHWLVEWPVRECKGVNLGNKPMLCSGTTIGTKQTMLDYLTIMYEEMLVWMEHEECNFGTNGDDQSMHNYLYYTGKLPFATAIPFRTGIVHTVGGQGSLIRTQHEQFWKKFQNMSDGQAWDLDFQGANLEDMWIGQGFDLTDKQGYFVNHDGTRSPVVHQYDRLGPAYFERWLNKQKGKLWK